ncbi:MAG TPA: nucleotidyltransferase domain-containing protein, partial [Chthoniobacterales bacterium]
SMTQTRPPGMARIMLTIMPGGGEIMKVEDHIPIAYAHRLASKVARYLKKRYGATKVMLYGSLVMGCYNPDFSDIDVYFEGVREEWVADALADCRLNFGEQDISGRKRIDYTAASSLPKEMQAYIRQRAEEL